MNNHSINVFEQQVPVNFISSANVVAYNDAIYGVGNFLQVAGEQPSLFMDGAVVLRLNNKSFSVLEYLQLIW